MFSLAQAWRQHTSLHLSELTDLLGNAHFTCVRRIVSKLRLSVYLKYAAQVNTLD